MNSSAETLSMLDLAVKATVLLLLGFMSASLLRQSSSARRSLVWLAVFGVLALLPASLVVAPLWTWQVAVGRENAPAVIAAPDSAMELAEKGNDQIMARDQVKPAARENEFSVFSCLFPRFNLGQWLGLGYLLIAAMLIARRLLGSVRLSRLRTTAADGRTARLVEQLRIEHVMWRRVDQRLSAQAAVPMTWGVLRPVLLLPADAAAWAEDDLRAAIRHEFAHIRHCDAAKRWLATLVTAFAWPHPLVWLAARAWRLEQERACDDFVIASGSEPGDYASLLLETARGCHQQGRCPSAALVMALPAGLETRIRAVTAADADRSPCSPALRLGALAVVLLTSGAGVLFQARAQEQPAPAVETARPVQIYLQGEARWVPKALVPAGAITGTPASAPSALEGVLTGEKLEEWRKKLDAIKGSGIMARPSAYTLSGDKTVLSASTRKADTQFGEPGATSVIKLAIKPTASLQRDSIEIEGALNISGGHTEADGDDAPFRASVRPGEALVLRGLDPLDANRDTIVFVTPKLVLPKPASVRSNRSIKIQSKFIEFSGDDPMTLPTALRKAMTEGPVALGDSEMAALLRSLSQRKGEEIVSAPSITTLSGKEARVEVVREFIYPSGVAMESSVLTPQAFEMMPVGIRLDATPEESSGEVATLKSLRATVTEFDGFITTGVENLVPDGPNAWKVDLGKRIEGRKNLIARGRFAPGLASVLRIDEKMKALRKDIPGNNEVSLPVFAISEWSGDVSLRAGTWHLSHLRLVQGDGELHRDRHLWCAVSAGRSEPIQEDASSEARKSGTAGGRASPVKNEPAADAAAERETVTLFGQVRRQGKYSYKEGMTLKDALDLARGATDSAVEIEIIREGKGGKKETLRIRQPWDTSRALQPGDTVIVR